MRANRFVDVKQRERCVCVYVRVCVREGGLLPSGLVKGRNSFVLPVDKHGRFLQS